MAVLVLLRLPHPQQLRAVRAPMSLCRSILVELPDDVPQWVLGCCNPEEGNFPSTPWPHCSQRHAAMS